MKKTVFPIVLIIFLTSCKANSVSEPTSVFVRSTEPISTAIPYTPTSIVTMSKIDFQFPATFSAFENQFPLSANTPGRNYSLQCVFDSFQIEYESIKIDNLEIRQWVKCYFRRSDHSIDYVNFPLQVINWDSLTWFHTITPEKHDSPYQNPKQCSSHDACGFDEIMPQEKPIAIYFAETDLSHKYMIGLGFGNQLSIDDLSQDFFKSLLSEVYVESMENFASTGDASFLPQFGNIEHFLLAYDYASEPSK